MPSVPKDGLPVTFSAKSSQIKSPFLRTSVPSESPNESPSEDTFKRLSAPRFAAVRFGNQTPTQLTSRFEDALVYTAQLHSSQRRKGSNVPYLSHLMAVAATVLEFGGTEDEAIAGLLHDAVEDQGGAATLAVIEKRYGKTVAAIVAGCSDTDVVPKPPWKARKQAYLAHLQSASDGVLLVSAADKLHNARAILADLRNPAVGDTVWSYFKASKADTLWYYRSLADTYLQKMPADKLPLAREVDAVVRTLELESQKP